MKFLLRYPKEAVELFLAEANIKEQQWSRYFVVSTLLEHTPSSGYGGGVGDLHELLLIFLYSETFEIKNHWDWGKICSGETHVIETPNLEMYKMYLSKAYKKVVNYKNMNFRYIVSHSML